MNNCSFTYKHYEEIISRASNLGYKFSDFTTELDSKHIIIRHDIDLDLQKALRMAEIEAKLNVNSTYLIWITSPFYNAFQQSNANIIKKLSELGHKVGLHFNAKNYNIQSINDMKRYLINERMLLENILENNIDVVSFHMPEKFLVNNNLEIEGIINTYHEKFFSGYKYLSDSEMRWREGCICNHLENKNYNRIQMLVHPIWWDKEANTSTEIMKRYFEDKDREVITEWKNHIKAGM